jgi:hypothetical protein
MNELHPQVNLLVAQLRSYALFAELLEHYLYKRPVLPVHLAERMFVEPATVSHWCKNKQLPEHLGFVHQMAAALALSALEKETLIVAWCNTRLVRDLIPYLEEAARQGDIDHVLTVVKSLLDEAKPGFPATKEDL